MTATVIILADVSGRTLRKVEVTTFEEVLEVHREYPRHDIGLFEDPTGATGEMWFYSPRIDDPTFSRRWGY